MSLQIDARGLLCPLPVLRLRKRLLGQPPGTRVTLLATDRAALVDVPHFCAEAGHRLIAAEPQDYLPEASELEAADVAFRRGRPEFASAQGWSGSRLTFYPVGTGGPGHGPVLGHARIPQDQRDHGWREQAIEVILRQTGQALQRLALTEEAEAERRRALGAHHGAVGGEHVLDGQ